MSKLTVGSGADLLSILHSIEISPDSWAGWTCLQFEISDFTKHGSILKLQDDVCNILRAQVGPYENRVFFTAHGDIYVFCRDIDGETLASVGRRVVNLFSLLAHVGCSFTIWSPQDEADDLMFRDSAAQPVLGFSKTSSQDK